MYLTLCIDAENRDEGVENHSEGTQQKTRPHSTEVRQLTRHNQAKNYPKSKFYFRFLTDMTIKCEHVQRLEL